MKKNSRAGMNVAISGNGAVAAMYEPGPSEVQLRVFEQDGSEWIERKSPFLPS
jgi:hypothetical protein